ncbi:MAG: signal peptidase I [Clostridia bacterium]|nr:signal peptidase I [Clostridia bacterium]
MSKKKQKLPLTPEAVIQKKLKRIADKEETWNFIKRLIMMGFVFYAMFGYFFGITPMKNNDMYPKISSGDVILYYRMDKKILSGDVVIFEKDGTRYVGRAVAIGGDEVEVTEESTLIINGSTMIESDIFYKTPRYGEEIEYPVKLKQDELFILCDFRDGAKDSRFFGPVSMDEVKGKAITILRRSGL